MSIEMINKNFKVKVNYLKFKCCWKMVVYLCFIYLNLVRGCENFKILEIVLKMECYYLSFK